MILFWLKKIGAKYLGVPTFKDTALFALCIWAVKVQMDYRVPSYVLFLLLPWVGIVIVITSFIYLAGQLLKLFPSKEPARSDLRLVQTSWELLLMGCVLYSVFLYINCAADSTDPEEIKTIVLDITEGEFDVGGFIPYARVDLRSWEDSEKVKRIVLRAGEKNSLWPNQQILVQAHAGILGLQWVSGLVPDQEALYAKVLDMAPTAAIARRNLVEFYIQHKRWQDAVEAARAYFRLRPNDADAAIYWGSKIILADPSGAIALMKSAAEHRFHYKLYSQLGSYLSIWKRSTEGLEFIHKAIQMEPDNPLAYHNEGMVLEFVGRMDEALVSYRKALSLNPNSVFVKRNISLLEQKIRAKGSASAWDR